MHYNFLKSNLIHVCSAYSLINQKHIIMGTGKPSYLCNSRNRPILQLWLIRLLREKEMLTGQTSNLIRWRRDVSRARVSKFAIIIRRPGSQTSSKTAIIAVAMVTDSHRTETSLKLTPSFLLSLQLFLKQRWQTYDAININNNYFSVQ